MNFDLSLCQWKLKGYYPWVPVKDKSMETGKELQGITDWIPATVPGGVHFDLYKNGLIPYPYKDMNSLSCEWVENRWWLYQTEIPVSLLPQSDYYQLIFEGLDYKARIYLGEEMICEHEGMYEPIEIEITREVSELQVLQLKVLIFHAPDEMGQIGMTSHTYTQKSRFNYKWDFSTRLVNLGIWGKCYIQGESKACLDNMHIITDYRDGKGIVRIQGNVQWNQESTNEVSVCCTLKLGDKEYQLESTVCANQIQAEFVIENPSLWYPNGYGEQPLYQLLITLQEKHHKLDCKNYSVGIHSISLLQNEDSPEGALPYTFVINGKKIYIKGVNMTPLDHIYGNVSKDHYEHTVKLMVAMNVNLVRVWGGGIIEKEEFYDACDRHGILVWQEFIQSSSGIDNVPSKRPEFLALLRKTAISAILRIRNNTSLAVWSGGNELTNEQGIPATYQDENISMLKKIVNRLDPAHFFFPTSASGPNEFINPEKGVSHDVHGNWNYHGNEEFYALNRNSDSLFHSEFGAEGMCSIRSLNRFISKEYQSVEPASANMVYRHHGEWWCTYERDDSLFGERKDIRQMTFASGWAQAEGLRFILESNRRRRFRNSGSIIWQINEPWPNVFCTSLVDYFQEPKMAYYWAKNAFADFVVSMDYGKLSYEPGEVFCEKIFVDMDMDKQDERAECEVMCKVQDMTGRVIHTQTIWNSELKFSIPKEQKGIFIVSLKAVMGNRVCENRYYFGCGSKHVYAQALQLKATDLKVSLLRNTNNTATYRIKNIGLTPALQIHPYTEQEKNLICDNSFMTLLPGEETTVNIHYSPKFVSGFLECSQDWEPLDIQFDYLNKEVI